MATVTGKARWSGVLIAVQPRIRLTRSFDRRSHTYQGYVLHVHGTVGKEKRDVLVAIGEAARARHQFRAGDRASGEGVPVADPHTEIAAYRKLSELGMIWEEEDWVDQDAVGHRGPDD
jgi:hypothetical protein